MVCSFVYEFVKVKVPQYLADLPLSKTTEELSKMNPDEMIFLGSVTVTALFILLGLWSMVPGGARVSKRINNKIQLDKDKVADTIPIPEAMATAGKDQLVMCRCWKSKNFPYCDGSHNAHNKATGDNVGPLIIKK
eukprot:TRINITY_DN6468_c1_g1_i1.p1 TRINITY_DN6468_c1_g1~~TRINITY_DN6468_c1_g1_i1.p1  ORF type:complete len:135 (+),score=43.41 TRINITY_DN6468_c1_g1_i1:52-456(+)